MKIETSIKPRRDGTVRLTMPSGETSVFAECDGVLVCEISDPCDIEFALSVDGFYPHDDETADISKDDLLAKAKEIGVPGVNGRMAAATIAAKIDAFLLSADQASSDAQSDEE
jgi:hypothetical protein